MNLLNFFLSNNNDMNYINVFNVKNYGALGNGSTDDTTAIQTTINIAYSNGGGIVYVPNGIYIIGGALLTNVGGINYNSQLYIPSVDLFAAERTVVTMIGETIPTFDIGGLPDIESTNTGAILRSTIQGTGIYPSVITSKGNPSLHNGFSRNVFNAQNIQIQITPNGSNKLTLGGINIKKGIYGNFINIQCCPYMPTLTVIAEPNVNDIFGIHMPSVNCEPGSHINSCNMAGFTEGYIISEHAVIENAIARNCSNGFMYEFGHHMSHASFLGSYWNKNDITAREGTITTKIESINTEWRSEGNWFDSIDTISDVSNYLTADITYHIIEAGVGVNNAKFSKTGGTNVTATAI